MKTIDPPAIETQGLSKTYPGKKGEKARKALVDVNLDVKPGEYIAIVGPSGSGKSSFMNILGLLDRPTSGTYRLDGDDALALRGHRLARERGKRIGFVFQGFNLLSKETALRNVALPMVYAEVGQMQAEGRARDKLDRVGIPKELMHHLPSELSGGQQQRVAIARALINNPVLLLADEPTSGLDPATKKEILDVFDELRKKNPGETPATIVVVTHDDETAARAERKVEFEHGRIVADGSTAGSSSAGPRRPGGVWKKPTDPVKDKAIQLTSTRRAGVVWSKLADPMGDKVTQLMDTRRPSGVWSKQADPVKDKDTQPTDTRRPGGVWKKPTDPVKDDPTQDEATQSKGPRRPGGVWKKPTD